MQQNILLYSEAKTARPFWWSSLDFWVVWAFSRLTTSEDWPFRPLPGLKGQISGLSASLRPGQPRNLARQPKKSCCFSSLCNKIPLFTLGQFFLPICPDNFDNKILFLVTRTIVSAQLSGFCLKKNKKMDYLCIRILQNSFYLQSMCYMEHFSPLNLSQLFGRKSSN